ncbi:MAG: RNA-directed polymerase [Patescibacteria group bacterium]|nr:RNA-directed polymerase [Patescibacteria group bacterium]
MQNKKITYTDIISIENLLCAWREFQKGKRKRKDVQIFQLHLMDNVFDLHLDLKNKTYSHGGYEEFHISDPKPRVIHKASVRDRLLHHAMYRILYPYFDKQFIHDSYSCRLGKGTHKACNRFRYFSRKVSQNNTRTCWVLQCDVRKFFASIDHQILLDEIKKYSDIDIDTLWLIENVVRSFQSTEEGKGLPLGNLTSQLLVNIYANKLDQYIKHALRMKYYIRYADDFVFLSQNKDELEVVLVMVRNFLKNELRLQLHPNKVFLKTLGSGVDFLGWVHFPIHRVLRTATKRKMMCKLKNNPRKKTVQLYLGLLGWGNTYKLKNKINMI